MDALLWSNSWKQIPPLHQLDKLHELWERLSQDINTCVEYYWKIYPSSSAWRKWNITHMNIRIPEGIDLGPWQNEVALCKI